MFNLTDQTELQKMILGMKLTENEAGHVDSSGAACDYESTDRVDHIATNSAKGFLRAKSGTQAAYYEKYETRKHDRSSSEADLKSRIKV